MIACKNCGGNVKFDIASQKMHCEHCDTFYDPYEFDSKEKDAEEAKVFETTVFTCPECGGELLTTDTDATSFCSFCGGANILYSRIQNSKRPECLIPFKKTKQDCKKAYLKYMSKNIFAPKELKDEKCIDSFRGIYMPYWVYKVRQQGEFKISASKDHRRGDYIIHRNYKLIGESDGEYEGLSYDASSNFSDNISQALAPFHMDEAVDFTPGYLSGFYADIADVDSDVYAMDIIDIAESRSLDILRNHREFSGVEIKSKGTAKKQLHSEIVERKEAMFPVWFMSYRKGDRVAYATVNGQNGKVVADVPIDTKKYLLSSILFAIPIFILLNLFFTFRPIVSLTVTSILCIIAMLSFITEIQQIINKDTDAYDKGKLSKQSGKKSNVKNKIIKRDDSIAGYMGGLLFALIAMAFCLWMAYFYEESIMWIMIACIVFEVIECAIAKQELKQLKNGQKVMSIYISVVSMMLALVLAVVKPVSDIYYYAVIIAQMISMYAIIVDCMNYFNILTTRKLPQFDKKGGDDRA